MSVHYCDICKKNIARIQIAGEGSFCLDCHNARMLEKSAGENTFVYPEKIAVLEPEGTVHTFQLEHILLGGIVSWEAREQNGGYHFHEISRIEEKGAEVAKRLIQKILDGVCTKTLAVSEEPAANLLRKDWKTLSLKDKGTICITEDPERDCEIAFEIDGQMFRSEELGRLLGAHAGFSLQYRMVDATAPVLQEDEYLVPVKITKSSLRDELERAIHIHGDRGVISYKAVLAFDEAVDLILNKLEVLAQSGQEEAALEAGKDMVRILLDLDTDDDYFPEYHLRRIGEIVDPSGQDEELTRLIESFYDC